MKTKVIMISLSLASLVYGENLFKNGDMSGGGGWRGDRTYLEENGNRVIELKASKNRKVSFSQEINNKGVKTAKLTFRYKSSDYTGIGFEVRKNTNGKPGPFNVIKAKIDGNWHTFTSPNVRVDNHEENTFVFSLLEGTGTMLFDDFVIEANP